MKLELELVRQVADKLPVSIGLGAANLVMKVGDREHNSEFLPQFKQNAQQRHRICAARNGHRGPVSGLEQMMLADVLLDFFNHGDKPCSVIVK